MLKRAFPLAATALLSVAGAVSAQSTSTLTGQVTDPTGASLPGATVVLRGVDTGLERTLTTDSSGNYTAASLQPGVYSVKVTAPGFGPFSVAG